MWWPRSYQGIFAALIGLMVLGTSQPPKDSAEPNKAESPSQLQAAADLVASAITQASQPAEQDRGCNAGEDKRHSDLCAQWKAADASASAAEHAWWTLLISTFGTGLLVWTLWETRANARRELRAYMSVTFTTLNEYRPPDGTCSATLNIIMKNGGQTPAYASAYDGNIIVMRPEQAKNYIAGDRRIKPRVADRHPITIHGGQEIPGRIRSQDNILFSDLREVQSGKASFFAFGSICYRDAFGAARLTRFCFEIKPAEFNPTGEGSDRTGLPDMIDWRVTPFHNDAT